MKTKSRAFPKFMGIGHTVITTLDSQHPGARYRRHFLRRYKVWAVSSGTRISPQEQGVLGHDDIDDSDMDDAETSSSTSTSDAGVDMVASDASIEPRGVKRTHTDARHGHEADEPHAKRRLLEQCRTSSVPTADPGEVALIVRDNMFETAPDALLLRSCSLINSKIGFSAVSKEAMVALCSQMEIYTTKLLSFVTQSMMAARRQHSTPTDFEFALQQLNLTSRHLRAHLQPSGLVAHSRPHFQLQDTLALLRQEPTALFGSELDGALDMSAKSFIPAAFPAFPSKHTYKHTAFVAPREMDPRKIREKATEGARNAEEAMRRLVKTGKAATNQLQSNRGLQVRPAHRERDVLLGAVLGDMVEQQDSETQRVVVNAEKQYQRKAVGTNK